MLFYDLLQKHFSDVDSKQVHFISRNVEKSYAYSKHLESSVDPVQCVHLGAITSN